MTSQLFAQTPIANSGNYGLTDEAMTQFVEQTLAFSQQLIRDVYSFTVELSLSDLGAIELPPALVSQADQAQLKSVAVLYLASELELARLLLTVETLVKLYHDGGLHQDLGTANQQLFDFWRQREQRFTERERQAIFARLFGTVTRSPLATTNSSNTAFESLMIDLAEALHQYRPDTVSISGVNRDIPVRMAAQRLATNLIPRSGGITPFVAQELVHTINQALAIIKHKAVQQALGAQSVWMALRRLNQLYSTASIDINSHVERGRTGMQLLSWLATVLPHLETTKSSLVSPDHPVVTAATAWLHASLALTDSPSTSYASGGLL